MPGTNDNNQGNDNSVFDLSGQAPTVISPDQTSMFQTGTTETVTRMEIPHDAAPVEASTSANTESEGEGVTAATKFKILATLVIVGIAGYAAYWVQEPVQLKTDVLNADSSSTAATTSTPAADSTKVADSSSTSSSTGTTSTSTAAADSTATSSSSTASTDTSAASAATSTASPDATASTNVSVDVSLFGFNPATLAIDKGTTVTWTNTSTADQTIIGSAPDGESFASPVLTSGKSFSYKFDQDADFQYYSTYNPALKATIKVGAGSTAPAAAADTASTTAPATNSTSTTASPANANPATTGVSPSASDNLGIGGPDLAAAQATNTNLAYANENMTNTAPVSTAAPTDQLYPAAATQIVPKKLSKTGPAEDLYAVILLGAAWLNRKKLAKVFKK